MKEPQSNALGPADGHTPEGLKGRAAGDATVGAVARFLTAGDRGLVVEFGEIIDRAVSDCVVRTAARIEKLAPEGVVAVTATFRSLLVQYDPLHTSQAHLVALIGPLPLGPPATAGVRRVCRVPVVYGGTDGPDLDAVAAAIGLTTAEVVTLHTAKPYHVYMLGFLPGYAYMGDLPDALRLPRLATPRVRLPAGSVAIAQQMTAVYPVESPGGWHLLGRTALRFFDAAAARPALLAPGDMVRFVSVEQHESARIAEAVGRGDYQAEWTEEAPA